MGNTQGANGEFNFDSNPLDHTERNTDNGNEEMKKRKQSVLSGASNNEDGDVEEPGSSAAKRIKGIGGSSVPVKGGTYYSIFGDDVKPQVHLKLSEYGRGRKDVALGIQDVQDLMLWTLLDDIMPPKWVFVQHKSLVRKVVVVLVNSLDLDTYVSHQADLNNINRIGSQACVLRAPWNRHQQDDNLITGYRSREFWKHRMLNSLFKRKKPKSKRKRAPPPRNYNSLAGAVAMIREGQFGKGENDDSSSSSGDDSDSEDSGANDTGGISGSDSNISGDDSSNTDKSDGGISTDSSLGDENGDNIDEGSRTDSPQNSSTVLDITTVTDVQKDDLLLKTTSSRGETHTIAASRMRATTTTTATMILQPDALVLSLAELKENGFPLETEDGYVETQDNNTPHDNRMIGMDCEMCVTTAGMEVTRVTLVGEDGSCIYDMFVKPFNDIVNYNTRYSGITASHLKNVTTRLKDVQLDILKMVSRSTILVGHSLENDLRALKIIHRRVIDTSVIYPHPRGKRYKNALRFLAHRYLNRQIQNGTSGHDSVEDALAALDLVKLKILKGLDYGTPKSDLVSIFSMLNDGNKRSILVDEPPCLNAVVQSSISTASCMSDEEAVRKAIGPCKSDTYQFVFVHLHDLEKYYRKKVSNDARQTAEKQTAANGSSDGNNNYNNYNYENGGDDEGESGVKKVLSKMNSRIGTIYDSIPENSLCIVMSSYGNLSEVEKVIMDKKNTQDWKQLESQNALIQQTIERVSNGLCFIGIK